MHISQLITSARVVLDLSGTTKREVLAPLAEVLARDVPKFSVRGILDVLAERERLGSTGIGKGIAIPHGRLSGLSVPIAALGRSGPGVAFDTLDGKPAHLIVALLSPLNDNKTHLASLAAISRFLQRKSVRDRLCAAPDHPALFAEIIAGDPLLSVPVSGDNH